MKSHTRKISIHQILVYSLTNTQLSHWIAIFEVELKEQPRIWIKTVGDFGIVIIMIYLLSVTCVWFFLRSQWPLLCHVLGYYALPQLGKFLSVFARGLSNGVSAECETPEKFLVGSMIRSIFSQKVKCLAQVSAVYFFYWKWNKKIHTEILETRIFLCNA